VLIRNKLILPEGYRATRHHGGWRLFDPDGRLLLGPADALVVEEHAWGDARCRIDQELQDEIAAFRGGTRPLEALYRVRQYFRMLDAVARSAAASETPPSPVQRPGWPVLAAAAVVALAIGTMVIGRSPKTALLPKPPDFVLEGTGVPSVIPSVAVARLPTPASPIALKRPTILYAVSIGGFASFETADLMKHLVRSKGYVVDVIPRGEVSLVVTPPLSTRGQADCVVNGLEGIGFPAHLLAWRAGGS
jgi:hypothetical protein